MKRILFLLMILFISISAVSAADNLSDSVSEIPADLISDDVSIAVLEDNSSDAAEPSVIEDNSSSDDVSYENSQDNTTDDAVNETENASNASDDGSINSTDSGITVLGKNLVHYIKASPVYRFKTVDANGTGVAVDNVSITFNKKTRIVSTDENGTGSFPIKGLKAGTYFITVTYENNTITNKIKLFSSRIIKNKNLASTYGTKVKYKIKLVNNYGKAMAGKKVVVTIGKKVYRRTTDSNGYTSISLNYNSGKYVISYAVDGLKGKNKYVVSNKVTLTILKWGLKGDVSKAPLIKKNMPDNKWVKKAVAATKKGLPLITIKGGKGKAVFMTAGVHGNELNSQVAAMKMIKHLTTHPIKGTVYIIPFVNVKAISQKVRLTDYDFNRVAHWSGTVSNNIINLIYKFKCDTYGDFHTTVSPGDPGINVVLGYTSPNKCIDLTNYIVNYAKVNRILFFPGEKYCWSLADYCNYKGTPAVICEVISPVNEVSSKATKLSFKQMVGYLKFSSII